MSKKISKSKKRSHIEMEKDQKENDSNVHEKGHEVVEPPEKKQQENEESVHINIRNINRGSTRDFVIGKIVSIGKMWQQKREPKLPVFSVVVSDADDKASFIELQYQGDLARLAIDSDSLVLHAIYKISGFSIEKVNMKKENPVCGNHKYRLVAASESFSCEPQVETSVLNSIPRVVLPELAPFSIVEQASKWKYVSAVGFVTEVSDLRKYNQHGSQSRSLILVENEEAALKLRVTIWGKQAIELNPTSVHRKWIAVLFGQVTRHEKYGVGLKVENGVMIIDGYKGSNVEQIQRFRQALAVHTAEMPGAVIYEKLSFQQIKEKLRAGTEAGGCEFEAILSDYIGIDASSEEYYFGPKDSPWPTKLVNCSPGMWKDKKERMYSDDQVEKVFQFKVELADPLNEEFELRASVFNAAALMLFNGKTAEELCSKKIIKKTEHEFYEALDEAEGKKYQVKARFKNGLIVESFRML